MKVQPKKDLLKNSLTPGKKPATRRFHQGPAGASGVVTCRSGLHGQHRLSFSHPPICGHFSRCSLCLSYTFLLPCFLLSFFPAHLSFLVLQSVLCSGCDNWCPAGEGGEILPSCNAVGQLRTYSTADWSV